MLARQNPVMAFTSLNHYLDYEWLYYAYELTRKDGVVGVDGQTAAEYAERLEESLHRLLHQLKSARSNGFCGHKRKPPMEEASKRVCSQLE